MTLNLGTSNNDAFALPLDALTTAFGIIGRRGSGKTNTAVVMVEEFIRANLPVVIIDPLGVWYGLRSSRDGQGEGLPVTILGGQHGDLPLEQTAGGLVADLVVEHPGAYLLDLSGFESRAAERRFATDFAERLYRNKAKDPSALGLVVDEADTFAPQQVRSGEERLLGAFEAIARRGRARGLGMVLITQRPAVLNKNLLSQVECLIAMQITAPQDREALKAWAQGYADKAEVEAFLSSLAGLQVGQAWLWSPSWLQLFQRVDIRQRDTFDSSATPKAGEVRVEPKVLAPVDLEELRLAMAATIEKVEADNPKKLRAEIGRLQRELRERPKEDCGHESVIRGLQADLERHAAEIGRIRLKLEQVLGGAQGLQSEIEAILEAAEAKDVPVIRTISTPTIALQPARSVQAAVLPRRESSDTESRLGKAERSILVALAQFAPTPRTKRQVAILTGYAQNGGGFNNAIGALRSKGYLIGSKDALAATSEGLASLGEFDPLPTGAALLEHWQAQLPRAERTILAVLAGHYPNPLAKEQLAAEAGYEATGGGFNNALGKLRTLELIERGIPRLSPELMD